ncbi:MAG TPA: hypothetical protein VKY85_14400 [Candidatus Angelobacter sp.]|nr:hypothetical protein [Candidatus Angelobacter sp.]
MPGIKARVLLICSLASLLCQTKELLAAAQDAQKAFSPGLRDERINEILVAIAKLDSRLKIIRTPDFSIESGDLTIKVKTDKAVFYNGAPYQNGVPQSGFYGQAQVSERFYGIEVILHYLLEVGGIPYGGVSVEERLTVLYEDTPRSKPLRPRTFASKPFLVGKDGTFQDRQVFGHFDTPVPDKTTQILEQELILNSDLIATIYIVRTPKEIRLVGYSVPPLISGLVLP